MVKNKIMKKFLGTANYMARLTFYPNRKHYSAAMVVKIEIFDGRNLDGDFDCTNIAEVADKVMKFYLDKTGHDIEIRRLARWFLEYLEDADITVPEMSTLIKDLQSTPQEILSRDGISVDPAFPVDEKDEDDDEEDELEEAVEDVAEDIEEAEEELSEEEIIEEVIEEVVEEVLEDSLEEAVDEDVDEDVVEDVAEEIAEEVTEDIAEEITEEVVEETPEEPTEEAAEKPDDEFMTEPVDLSEEAVKEQPAAEDELEEAFEEFADE